jgi:anti-sigma regulatory factor (Ser/Thr protein kinase)
MLSLIERAQQPWIQWQQSVIRLLRAEFNEALHHIGFDEVDWASWRTFYDEGRSPKAAIDRALERDF